MIWVLTQEGFPVVLHEFDLCTWEKVLYKLSILVFFYIFQPLIYLTILSMNAITSFSSVFSFLSFFDSTFSLFLYLLIFLQFLSQFMPYCCYCYLRFNLLTVYVHLSLLFAPATFIINISSLELLLIFDTLAKLLFSFLFSSWFLFPHALGEMRNEWMCVWRMKYFIRLFFTVDLFLKRGFLI